MSVLLAFIGALSIGSAEVQDEWADVDCANAGSTIEQNVCAGREVRALEENLRLYTDTAYRVLRENADTGQEPLIAEIAESQRLWEAYVEAACGAVDTYWQQGTIRTVMAASCQMELIRERTHYIWREYLTPMEGLARLPEPERSTYDGLSAAEG